MADKKKDMMLYIVAGIGTLIVIYVFFFTNIFFDKSGENVSVDITQSGNGADRFNYEVPEKTQKDYESKLQAYQEEQRLEMEKADKLREAENRSNTSVSDLSEMMAKEKAQQSGAVEMQPIASPPVLQSEKQEQPQVIAEAKKDVPKVTPKVSNAAGSSTSTVKKQPAKQKVVTPIEPVKEAEPKRRKRSEDPSYESEGDGKLPGKEPVTVNGQAKAVIQTKQNVKAGSAVTLRLTEDFPLEDGCVLKANSFLTGACNFNSQQNRVEIYVTSIKCNQQFQRVNLVVYDGFDGLGGIPISEITDEQNVGKEVIRSSAGDVATRMGVPVVDRVITSTSEKKTNTEKATLNDGHKIIIRQEKVIR